MVRTLVSSSEDRGVIKSSILPRDEFVLSSPKFHSLAALSKWRTCQFVLTSLIEKFQISL